MSSTTSSLAPRLPKTNADAERALEDLAALIEELSVLMEQETALVHAGRMKSAAEIEPRKRELAGRLFTSGEWLKANAKVLGNRYRRTAPCSTACRTRSVLCCRKT